MISIDILNNIGTATICKILHFLPCCYISTYNLNNEVFDKYLLLQAFVSNVIRIF